LILNENIRIYKEMICVRSFNMNFRINGWKLLGFASVLCCANAFAVESKVYDVDGWTITITPQDKVPPRVTSTPAVKQTANATESIQKTKSQLEVRPVSFTQQDAAQPVPAKAEAPVPADLVPQAKTSEGPVIDPGTGLLYEAPIIRPRVVDRMPDPRQIPPQAQMYKDIYSSLPYIRTEYGYYPNYRHDTTMELLFNQMRTMIIQRNSPVESTPTNINNYIPYTPFPYSPYNYLFQYQWPMR
jgi:hypothetical protein